MNCSQKNSEKIALCQRHGLLRHVLRICDKTHIRMTRIEQFIYMYTHFVRSYSLSWDLRKIQVRYLSWYNEIYVNVTKCIEMTTSLLTRSLLTNYILVCKFMFAFNVWENNYYSAHIHKPFNVHRCFVKLLLGRQIRRKYIGRRKKHQSFRNKIHIYRININNFIFNSQYMIR